MNREPMCDDCGWSGKVREIEVTEESGHEVWQVFSCPVCGMEFDRQPKRAVKA